MATMLIVVSSLPVAQMATRPAEHHTTSFRHFGLLYVYDEITGLHISTYVMSGQVFTYLWVCDVGTGVYIPVGV